MSTLYPKPHGPSMIERMAVSADLPILTGPPGKAPASQPIFADVYVLEISPEEVTLLKSQVVDADLLPKYLRRFDFYSGSLNYIKFCKESDVLALKKNVQVLSRVQKAAGWFQGLVIAANNGIAAFIRNYEKNTGQSTEHAKNSMGKRFFEVFRLVRPHSILGLNTH